MEERKKYITASSSTEAEFVTYFETTNQILWLKNFSFNLKIVDNINRPLKIYCNNFIIFFLLKNYKYSKSTRHIDIKYLSIKKEMLKQKVLIEHISTEMMITDPLTNRPYK